MNSKSDSGINNATANTLQLFSKFFELVTKDEKDSDYLKNNLQYFLQTFHHHDKSFTQTNEYLSKLIYNPSSEEKSVENLSDPNRQIQIIESINPEKVKRSDASSNAKLNASSNAKSMTIPDLKNRSLFLIEYLNYLNNNTDDILIKLDLEKEEEEVENEKYEATPKIEKVEETKKFIQRCFNCNKEYVENKIKKSNEYLCNLCR